MPHQEYGVAISFLSADCPLAEQIADRLSPLKVFVFSRNQEDVAGSDGMETFRDAFRNKSKMQIILYRAAWGETPWTRIEATAIQERCLAEGWRGLFFVALEDAARPKWVPDTHIHFDLNQYSLEELAGAIKARAQELGSELRKENPMERARRAQARVAFEEETRNLFRHEEGVKLARAEAQKACDIMEPVVTNAAEELCVGLRKARQVPHGIAWSTPKAAMTATFRTAVNMLDQNEALEVWTFKHDIVLPGENSFYMEPGLPKRHCFLRSVQRSNLLRWLFLVVPHFLVEINELDEVKRILPASPVGPRSRTLGQRTATGPMPV